MRGLYGYETSQLAKSYELGQAAGDTMIEI